MVSILARVSKPLFGSLDWSENLNNFLSFSMGHNIPSKPPIQFFFHLEAGNKKTSPLKSVLRTKRPKWLKPKPSASRTSRSTTSLHGFTRRLVGLRRGLWRRYVGAACRRLHDLCGLDQLSGGCFGLRKTPGRKGWTWGTHAPKRTLETAASSSLLLTGPIPAKSSRLLSTLHSGTLPPEARQILVTNLAFGFLHDTQPFEQYSWPWVSFPWSNQGSSHVRSFELSTSKRFEVRTTELRHLLAFWKGHQMEANGNPFELTQTWFCYPIGSWRFFE